MHSVDCVVVGAGVIGLAIARQLAIEGRETLILERHDSFGKETSSRNSEVIHAGIYYEPGSLKARHCVRGREPLVAYCISRGVAHRRCGKLIVATAPGQTAALEKIFATAQCNGVTDLQWLDRSAVVKLEPSLRCHAALLSPSTGIVDSHALMLALLGDAEFHGATFVPRSAVSRIESGDGLFKVHVEDVPDAQVATRWLVNSGGLGAPALAGMIEGFPPEHVPTAYYAKGNYFTLEGRAPFSRLIYPIPEPGGLGVHLTLDLAGQARFGPDVEWVKQPEFGVEPERARDFYPVIRTYWPGLTDGALKPAYAGVRPKIAGPAEPAADFRIDGPEAHGIAGIVNLFGIESPGMTAALSIAEHVVELMRPGR
jgi:L-2-hydroxyglutarate oxidase LhgO